MSECFYCKHHKGIISSRIGVIDFYDEIDVSNTKYEIWKTELAELGTFSIESKRMTDTVNSNMNPKEKLFAKFFSEEKMLIKDMSDDSLKAHIEELQQIAHEARARLTASDSEARERAANKKKNKGFSTVVEVDGDFTSNAINNISDRQKKMTKIEKEIERLVGMGISREDAENMYKASTILAVKHQGAKAVVNDGAIKDIVNSIVNATPEEKKLFSNPFVKKEEEISMVPVTIIKQDEKTITVVVNSDSDPDEGLGKTVQDEKPAFINPFVK